MARLIDLHIHTSYSDGIFSPFQIIDIAKKNKLDTISITDHDTIEAYTDEVIKYAKEKNINLISGIELSTKTEKCGIHILGYNIDIKNCILNKELAKIQKSRHNYLYSVVNKLKKLGYEIDINKLDKIKIITKSHIALHIITNQRNNEVLNKYFNHIPNKSEFIEKIMNEGCPAFVEKETLPAEKAAKLIKKAGGKIVIAHPVAYTYEDSLTQKDIKKIVNDIKADGLEAYYIYVDNKNNKHDDIDSWLNFAKKK